MLNQQPETRAVYCTDGGCDLWGFGSSTVWVMKWGEAACRYIKQYMDDMTGEEKNKKAAEFIMELAKQAGLKITEEQARSIAQAAYDAMKRGEADSAHEGQVSSDAES